MLNSNYEQFSAYCHECDVPMAVLPAPEEGHRKWALNHSKRYRHTCSLYMTTGVLRNYRFVPTNKTEVARFSNSEELS